MDYKKEAQNYHKRGYYTHEVANDLKFWQAVRKESDRIIRRTKITRVSPKVV